MKIILLNESKQEGMVANLFDSWQRVPIPPFLRQPPILLTPFCRIFSNPLPHHLLFLLNYIMGQNFSNLHTLVLATPWYVFYATRHPIYFTDDIVFASTLI